MTWEGVTRDDHVWVVNLYLTFTSGKKLHHSVNCLFITFDHFSPGLFLGIYVFQILNFVGYIYYKYILPIHVSFYFIFEDNRHARSQIVSSLKSKDRLSHFL